MSLNSRYEKSYILYKKYNWWFDAALMAQTITQAHLSHRFDPAYRRDLTREHRRHFPRRRIIKLENLPAEIVQPISDKWLTIALVYVEDRAYTLSRLRRFLADAADKIDLTPQAEETIVDSRSPDHNQTQSHKYATAPLDRKADLLKAYGFTARIEPESYQSGDGVYRYVLISNAAEYQLEAVNRMGFENLTEWAADMWKRGVNPQVYNPWLPDQVVSDSLVAAGFSPL